jgi:rRNA small subunit pseudouridine methyltransferase Nep1
MARAKNEGKRPDQILLDRAYHHGAMLSLSNALKRGRPDIAHVTLLGILSTPLNKEGHLKSYVHTINDHVIEVDESIRLPRNYTRFIGLMERLFADGRVPLEGETLLSLKKMNIRELIKRIQPTFTVAFSSVGTPNTLQEVCGELARERRPAVMIGGFAHGHFSKAASDVADMIVSIYDKPLDAWVVASRIVYEYEVSSAK